MALQEIWRIFNVNFFNNKGTLKPTKEWNASDTTSKLREKKSSNTNLRRKMHQEKTIRKTLKMMKMTTNSLDMKKWETSDTLTGALWIWGTLVMEMESFWKNWMLGRTGNFHDCPFVEFYMLRNIFSFSFQLKPCLQNLVLNQIW